MFRQLRFRQPLSLLLLLLVSLGVLLTAQETKKQVQQQTPQEAIVYVTKTGAKYHRAGCRYLSKSKIPMTLKEAQKKYTPCSVCKPPQ
jgi:hypothetical protein